MKIYDREYFVVGSVYGAIGAFFTYHSIKLVAVSLESGMYTLVTSIILDIIAIIALVLSTREK